MACHFYKSYGVNERRAMRQRSRLNSSRRLRGDYGHVAHCGFWSDGGVGIGLYGVWETVAVGNTDRGALRRSGGVFRLAPLEGQGDR